MVNKTIFKTILSTTILFVIIVTYLVCSNVAEKFFFDKFYYQKSYDHGYGMYKDKPVRLEIYGDRSKDIISLNYGNFNNSTQKNNNYKIAIIGDSYPWGLGVRFPLTVASRLKNQLLTQRNDIDVLLLAKPGDSILDYYSTYKKISQQTQINIYIFFLVFNDLAFNHDDRIKDNDFENIIKNCQNIFPETIPNYIFNWQEFYSRHPVHKWKDVVEEQNTNIDKSWSNPINLCVLNYIASRLPQNSLFFITDNNSNPPYNSYYQTYLNEIQRFHHNIITFSSSKHIHKYDTYWQKNSTNNFSISKSEFHPNDVAHQIFADLLSTEIINNKKWGLLHE